MANNLADVMIEGLADLGGGVAQRFAYEQSQNIGMITTGAFIVAGVIIPMFMKNQITDIAAKGMFHSGAVIAGWVGAEKVFQLGTQPGQMALRPGGERLGLPAGRGRYMPAIDGVRSPSVAISGVNPNTGETILDSRT
jgi:hypothetical protein